MHKNNLIIFLKYPEPGKVKTRLAKDIGDKKAADVYFIFIKHLLENFLYSENYKVTIKFTPQDKAKEVSELFKIKDIEPQHGNDLGEKISNAFDTSFSKGYSNTIIIGSDCIDLTNNDIENGFSFLSSGFDSVIGPTYDGGYYLIGLSKKNYPSIFKDIGWSSEKVFKQTIHLIKSNDMNYKILDYYNDIDEISDINSNVIKIINSYNPNLRIQINS